MAAHDTQRAAALGAGTWAASLQRDFYDLFPASCLFQRGWTLRCGPSLQHLQLSTHGLILPHGLNFTTWTSKEKNQKQFWGLRPLSHHGTPFLKPWRNPGLPQLISSALTPRLPLRTAGWKWLPTGNCDSNSSRYQNCHFCALSVTNSALVFPLLFNPLDSRARSHKNSFQYLHHRNSPKP